MAVKAEASQKEWFEKNKMTENERKRALSIADYLEQRRAECPEHSDQWSDTIDHIRKHCGLTGSGIA